MNSVLQKRDNLPPEIIAIIEGEEIVNTIDAICDNFDIPYSWRGELIRATISILSGTMSPTKFIPFIMDEYLLDREQALQITLQINEKIFSEVKPQLASLHNIEDEKLAHKIKVPHKPFIEEILDSQNSFALETNDFIPKETGTPTPYISQSNLNTKPIIETKTNEVESDTSPLSGSALINKLNNMRADPYREQF